MAHLPDCFRVDMKKWYLSGKLSILQLLSFPIWAESVCKSQNPRKIKSVAVKIEDEEEYFIRIFYKK